MARTGSTRLSSDLAFRSDYLRSNKYADVMGKSWLHSLSITPSSHASRQDAWSSYLQTRGRGPIIPVFSRCNIFVCRSSLISGGGNEVPALKSATLVLTRLYKALLASPIVLKLISAAGIVAFAVYALGPLMCMSRSFFFHKTDSSWKKSRTYYILTSYIQPLLLWTGITLVCRALDTVILPSEVSQSVKQRLLYFIRSLTTVLAFAYCLSSLIEQAQKFVMESKDSTDARNMGFQFAGKAVYSAVWVAAVSLFMELLGFSTQKWLTAGGLGTVLLTLAGREILTNFLSSIIIHATRPFVLNEWIQTKIEGYEVSGTVEHVGWWSPTIIRGDDREAVHIPNHKFTVNVVRNLSQKTHWRIKTHLAISHLDVNKINSIVADMRKVLAKNPQVEQQKLHRRVFLEDINAENQALMILISCFVKTSRIEEYLCVKETILQDLLRVISHHRARLATPIRTVQKYYSEADVDDVPFPETIFSRRSTADRPLLLIEPSYRINGDDKTKVSSRSARSEEEKDDKIEATSTSESDATATAGSKDTDTDDKTVINQGSESKSNPATSSKAQTLETEGFVKAESNGVPVINNTKKPNQQIADMEGVRKEVDPLLTSQVRQEMEKPLAPSVPSGSRPALEENIVLGVAIDGPKRTLPIEDGTTSPPPPENPKELMAHRSSSTVPSSISDDKHDPIPAAANTVPDQRNKEK